MARCFVVHPFDKGRFDKRYDDVFEEAIRNAELEPYRVDRDPSVNIPIEQIEDGIRNSEAVLVDITSDNPNVWFELGFAIASQKEVVLVCSNERETPFPFDVRHRAIIEYTTDSISDFKQLGEKITKRLKSLIARENRLGRVANTVAPVEGLRPHEIAALVAVAQEMDTPESLTSIYSVRHDMTKAGFTPLATTLGLKTLIEKHLVEHDDDIDDRGDHYIGYRATEAGLAWLIENTDKLALRSGTEEGLPF